MAADRTGYAGPAFPGLGMPAPNRISVGRKQAALGLLWQPAQPELAVRDQARLAGGARGGFDLRARHAGARQLGFGATRDGFAPGMLAGATAIDASGWGENWLAAFRLPAPRGSWWIVAMRESLIYEDQLHSSETAARAALKKSLEAPDWDQIVAPASWNIEGARRAELAEILSLSMGVPLLRVNWAARAASLGAAAMLAAAALAYGGSRLSQSGLLPVEETRQVQPAAGPVFAYPWINAPAIAGFAQNCVVEMDRLMLLPPGWLVESLICVWSGKTATATVTWKRTNGRQGFLRAAAARHKSGSAMTAYGSKAELSAPVPVERRRPQSAADPWEFDRLETVLRDRFRSLGLAVGLARRSDRIVGIAGGRKVSRSLDRFDLGIKTSAGILEYARLISDIPALVPEALVYRPDTNVWQLTARAYPQPSVEDPDK